MLFTRPRTDPEPASAEPEPDGSVFPAGYDDEESEMFIPLELRPYWPGGELDFNVAALRDENSYRKFVETDMASDVFIALAQAEKTAPPPPVSLRDRNPGRGPNYPDHVPWERRGRYLHALDYPVLPSTEQIPDLYRRRYLHNLALTEAARRKVAADNAALNAARQLAAQRYWEQQHTCELCGDVAEVVEARSLPDGREIRADPDCRALVVQKYLDRVAARTVAGIPLGDRADAWLDQ